MEIKRIFRNIIELRWSYDHKYYSIRRFNDGNGCSSSFGSEVLKSVNKDSQI